MEKREMERKKIRVRLTVAAPRRFDLTGGDDGHKHHCDRWRKLYFARRRLQWGLEARHGLVSGSSVDECVLRRESGLLASGVFWIW
jgi:hypothetical protein